MNEVRRYTIMGSMGIVAREGLNTVVLGHGTDLVFASDYDALAARVQAVEQERDDRQLWAEALAVEKDSLVQQLAASQQRVKILEEESDIWEKSSLTKLVTENATLQATLAEREATISELINRDARQQDREKNWRECFEEFKDLANGVERKYLQSHAVAIKNSLDTARQDAARLREALQLALARTWDGIDSAVEFDRQQCERALKGA